jgi:hypothetical protein
MVAKASLAFFRSDLPNRTPLMLQFVWVCDACFSRPMTTPMKCSHSGPDFFTASVIAAANVLREIDFFVETSSTNSPASSSKTSRPYECSNVAPLPAFDSFSPPASLPCLISFPVRVFRRSKTDRFGNVPVGPPPPRPLNSLEVRTSVTDATIGPATLMAWPATCSFLLQFRIRSYLWTGLTHYETSVTSQPSFCGSAKPTTL